MMVEHLPSDITGYLIVTGSMIARYLIIAGALFAFFYIWRTEQWKRLKIQIKVPKPTDLQREFFWSIVSLAIISSVFFAVFLAKKAGYTRMYWDIDEYGWGYFLFSIPLFIVLHDTYFYWTHRLMHWKPIFKYVHLTHHRSTNPTPWAAFAFHPIEAVIEAGIMPLIAFTIPAHPLSMALFGLYQMFLNVYGHCGYEIMPKGFTQHPLFKWFNTPTHHNMHHSKFSCNYGLYFNYWDRIMGTNHKDYHKTFEAVKARPETTEIAPQNLEAGTVKV